MAVSDSTSSRSRWDGVGQFLSALCIVHCVVLPLVLGLLPVAVSGVMEGEAVHRWLLVPVVTSALVAFLPGWRLHRRASAPGLAVLGLMLLSAGAFLVPEGATGPWETVLTLSGGVVMVMAHACNRSLCRDCCPAEAA
ncbi:MerC domain-containing protein [Pyxidicoccus parkwayensis]|uniref:MerC domain-containing protein n=1 Tax=Pyxidicoccus parkwayensis TaxID=2813578 RepID=A0ABX7PAA0_9BACT|nr:MerC domain-containing protein [Pyxidicoccus parkwaysis]QSQ27424.1 MerC domain-containing protein [Pyxidicoccus parkwaysis]